jgi:membrane protease YdiL (CAAX protease family)
MDKKWTIKDLAIITLSIIGILGLSILIVRFLKPEPSILSLIIEIPLYLLTIIMIFYFIYKKEIPLEEYGIGNFSFKYFFFSLLIALGLLFVGGFIYELINNLFGLKDDTLSFLESISSNNIWINIINLKVITSFLAPFAEELFFRGVIFKFFRQRKSFLYSATVSSLIFSLIHFNLAAFPFLFLLGFVCAFVFEKFKSILYPIIVHMVINNFGANVVLIEILK